MAHEIYWLKPKHVLYVSYQGHQSPDTLKACLDDMATHLDTLTHPAAVLINWLEVTGSDSGVLKSHRGHRAYGHPMAARGVLVGFNPLEAMLNESTSVNTRGDKNTAYFSTMDAALDYLKPMLEGTAN